MVSRRVGIKPYQKGKRLVFFMLNQELLFGRSFFMDELQAIA